jgi:hypothetical protein
MPPLNKTAVLTAIIVLLLSGAALADQDHTRVVFRQVMARIIAAAGEESTFHSITGKEIEDDHRGDARYAVTVVVPIFAHCEVRNDWHVPTAVTCSTNPNPDANAVRRRFEQMSTDLKTLIRSPRIEIGDCDGTAIFPNGERCFIANIPGGEIDLSIQSDSRRHKYLLIRVGNY